VKTVAESLPLLVLLPTPVYGGHEAMLIAWLREAVRQGLASPRLIVREHADRIAAAAESAGLRCERLYHGRHESPLHDMLTTWEMARGHAEHGPVLFAPGMMLTHRAQLIAARVAGAGIACYVPIGQDVCELGYRFALLKDTLTSIVVRGVDEWLTISPAQAQRLSSRWLRGGLPLVIPNLTDGEFKPVRMKGGCERKRLRALFAGRFDPYSKGLDLLLKALSTDWAWSNWLELTFQGDGVYERQLQLFQAEAARRGACIHLRPWGPLAPALECSDVLLLPSRFEGVPVVALEALMAGVLVVASDRSSLGFLISTECEFPLGNPSALFERLRRAQDCGWRHSQVVAAQRRVADYGSSSVFEASVRQAVHRLAHLKT
jgi:glycosyltransferase involved in cell wall biosynthesis